MKGIGWLAGSLTLAALVVGFALLGSPAEQRAFQRDLLTRQQMRYLVTNAGQEFRSRKTVPARQPSTPLIYRPREYGPLPAVRYRKLSSTTFELCTEMNQSSRDFARRFAAAQTQKWTWTYEAGPACLVVDVEKPTPPDLDLDRTDYGGGFLGL